MTVPPTARAPTRAGLRPKLLATTTTPLREKR